MSKFHRIKSYKEVDPEFFICLYYYNPKEPTERFRNNILFIGLFKSIYFNLGGHNDGSEINKLRFKL